MGKHVSRLVCCLALALLVTGFSHPVGSEASVASVAVKAPGVVWRSLRSKVDDAARFVFRRTTRHGDDAARVLRPYYDDLARKLSPVSRERLSRLKGNVSEDALRKALKQGDSGIRNLYRETIKEGVQSSGVLQYLLGKGKGVLKWSAGFVKRHPIFSTLLAIFTPYWREAVVVSKGIYNVLHFLVSHFGLLPGVFVFLLWGYLAWAGVKRTFLWVFGKLSGFFRKAGHDDDVVRAGATEPENREDPLIKERSV